MKLKINQLFTAVMLIAFSLAFVGCSQLEEAQPNLNDRVELFDIPTTIYNIQNGILGEYSPNARSKNRSTFSTFNAALGASGLASVFSRNDLTAFAPTDAAFAELGLNPGNIRSLPNLTDILLYHVVAGTVLSTDLSNTFAGTVNGSFIGINADDLTINGANIVAADIRARNGVIHAIDKVLLPANLYDLLGSNPEYSVLVSAVDALGLADALKSEEGSLTVFAPNNTAFVNLLDATNQTDLAGLVDLLGADYLTQVLLYHVVGGTVLSTDLSDGAVGTLAEVNVTVDLETLSLIDETDGASGITGTDFLATNGVIHTLDRVLLLKMSEED